MLGLKHVSDTPSNFSCRTSLDNFERDDSMKWMESSSSATRRVGWEWDKTIQWGSGDQPLFHKEGV